MKTDKLIRNECRAYTSKPDGGEIICKLCGRILGNIAVGKHRYLKLTFFCKCDAFCKVELSKGEIPVLEYPNRKIYQKENLHICPHCERELFLTEEENILNYAFNAVCKCGVEYDKKYILKKLG